MTGIKKEKVKITVFAAAILAAGLALRLCFAAFIPTEQLFDFATYREIAVNIKNGLGHTLDGVPVAWQGPLYPCLLGFFYSITSSDSEFTGKILNVILSVLNLPLSYFIYKKLLTKKSFALAAFAITAFLPAYVAYVNVLGTEILFVFTLSTVIFFQLYFPGKRWAYPVLGLLIGLCALTKPFMLAYPAVCAVIFWISRKNLKETCLFLAILVTAMCAVVAPWTYRNYKEFGRFIPVSYNSGYVLYINNNASNENGAWLDLGNIDAPKNLRKEIEKSLSEPAGLKGAADLEPVLKDAAYEFILNNPAEFLKLGFLRVSETFFNGQNDVALWAMNGWDAGGAELSTFNRDKNFTESILNVILLTFSVTTFIFMFSSVRSLFAALKPKTQGDPLKCAVLLNIMFFIAVVFFFEGQPRYAFPVYPFMIYAFLSLIERSRGIVGKNRLS